VRCRHIADLFLILVNLIKSVLINRVKEIHDELLKQLSVEKMNRELPRSSEKEIPIISINRDAFIRTIAVKAYSLIKAYLTVRE
jgi:hypothetical protein